jgi:hypothetical protein
MKTILLTLFFSISVHAQDFTFNKESGKAVPNFVGELKLIQGRVLRTTGGRPRVVQIGEKFYPKDIVVTEANASMKILIADNTWLALGPETELIFLDFEFKDKNERKIHYELKRGQLSANIRQEVKSGEVKFRSKYSSMGVRGTKIMMNYREVNGKGISEYALAEGEAEVTDQDGKSHTLLTGERMILIQDEKAGSSSQIKLGLSEEDVKKFTSPEAEEDKGIRPFMPYYEPKEDAVTKREQISEKAGKKDEASSPVSGSFNNLKKLNEQLKHNQKKRR